MSVHSSYKYILIFMFPRAISISHFNFSTLQNYLGIFNLKNAEITIVKCQLLTSLLLNAVKTS